MTRNDLKNWAVFSARLPSDPYTLDRYVDVEIFFYGDDKHGPFEWRVLNEATGEDLTDTYLPMDDHMQERILAYIDYNSKDNADHGML